MAKKESEKEISTILQEPTSQDAPIVPDPSDEVKPDTKAVSIERLDRYSEKLKEYMEERFPIFFCTNDEEDIKNTIESTSLTGFWLIVKVPASIVQTDSIGVGEYPIQTMKYVSEHGGLMATFYILKNPWDKGGSATYTSNPIGNVVYTLNIEWSTNNGVYGVEFGSQTI